MRLNEDVLKKISNIKWFVNVGSDFSADINYGVIDINMISDAKRFCEHPDWENTTLNESNNMSSFLDGKFENKYLYWNSLAKEAKQFISSEINPKINDLQICKDIGSVFLDCVQWDLGHILMADAYKKYYRKNEFYKDQLVIYEAGHFPCGFDHETASFYVY